MTVKNNPKQWRIDNVAALQKEIPELDVFYSPLGVTDECVEFLGKEKLTIGRKNGWLAGPNRDIMIHTAVSGILLMQFAGN